MFKLLSGKNRVRFALLRAHLCTLAIAVGFNSVWRVPTDAFRYGGLQFLIVHSAAIIVIALPATLLQLAAGQLSQQDAVGMWRAVPFFKGVGYLRLLITFVGSIHTLIYVALTATYFLYSLSNPLLIMECIELAARRMLQDDYEEDNLCANHTVTVTIPVLELPEYYVAVGLIATALWIVFPFVLYSPVKCMKRIFYVLAPSVLVLLVIVTATMGHKDGLASFHQTPDWRNFIESRIWHDAVTQAFWSSQVAGGYLVSIGGTVYSDTDIQWTSIILIGSNILTSWLATLLWHAITGPRFPNGLELSLLVQAHHAAKERGLPKEWPLVLFVAIFLSGIISMITLLYPIYDRFRRIGGERWRFISIASSFVGIVFTLGVLVQRLPALHILDTIVAPFLTSFTTILEITAFVFIYGWKTVVEDIEFSSGGEMRKFWVLAWCATPGVIIPFTVWWMAVTIIEDSVPWESAAIITTASFAILTFFLFAFVTVLRQEQYDYFSKLLSSFKPSRHWGPRDPITHYYWLTRRGEDRSTAAQNRFNRRNMTQLYKLPNPMVENTSNHVPGNAIAKIDETQRRSHSDDLIYTIYRRQYLKDNHRDIFDNHKRPSKSVDWDRPDKLRERGLKYLTDIKPLGPKRHTKIRIETVVPIDVRRISYGPR